MKVFVIACLASIALAIVSGVVFSSLATSSADAYSTSAVRLQ
jgi:hypothetical protein